MTGTWDPDGSDDDFKLVSDRDDLSTAIQVIKNEEVLFIHVTGNNLGRKGFIDLIAVSTLDKGRYLFDVATLGEDVFEAGLREILEWQRWLKVMYDCKRTSDALYHVHNVKLSNLIDVQLLEVIHFEKNIATGEATKAMQTKTLRGLQMSCEKYLKGTPVFDRLNEHPKPQSHYKVVLIRALYEVLKKDEDLTAICEASERYADHWRSYTTLPEDKYWDHPFLPQNIIVCHNQDLERTLVCSGCKKRLIPEQFDSHHDSETKRKCITCRYIQREVPDIIWIDDSLEVTTAIEKLLQEKSISVVLQPYRLARKGPLDIIFIGTDDWQVFVFDVTLLGDHAFDLGLRELLESTEVKKLVFNVPDSCDALNAVHNVYLRNFFDLQILEVIHRKSLATNNEYDSSIIRMKGFKSCIQRYLGFEDKKAFHFIKDVEQSSSERSNAVENVWAERPLYPEVLNSWSAGALNFFSLFEALKKEKDLDFLASASERFANHMRSLEKLPIDKYIFHPYLPLDVLASEYTKFEVNHVCMCCKKMLPSEDLGLVQESGRLKCKICRIVDQDEPDVIWVDDSFSLNVAISDLIVEKTISVTCHKKARQDRNEPLEDIFVGTDDSKVYIFDIQLLGEKVFECGLRDIFEGFECVKLMFDCKDSADTLHRMHNVWLNRVLDIQVLEVIHREKSSEGLQSRHLENVDECKVLNSLVRSIHAYVKKGSYSLKLDAEAFGNEELFVQTAKANWKAAINANMFALFYKLQSGIDKQYLFQASQRYVDYLRSYETLPPKRYVYNKFLPLNILNDPSGIEGDIKEPCGGCQKSFLSRELQLGHAKDKVRKCAVCIEIDKGEPIVIWVDTSSGVAEAARTLLNEDYVTIVSQRHNLARSGPMDVIFIGTEDCTVYVFDITTLGNVAFDSGLRSVFQNETTVKLMFDCRDESDTLHKMHDTFLTNVIDVQLLNVMQWRCDPHNKNRHRVNDKKYVQRLIGWKSSMKKVPRLSLKCSPNFFLTGNVRDAEAGRNVWAQRPLDSRLVTYWAAGTLNMFTMFETYKPGLDTEQASRASARYVDYFRSYNVLPSDTRYIFHSYLPHNILTKVTSLDIMCTGCLKKFARDEFNAGSVRSGIQKCRVCLYLKQYEYRDYS